MLGIDYELEYFTYLDNSCTIYKDVSQNLYIGYSSHVGYFCNSRDLLRKFKTRAPSSFQIGVLQRLAVGCGKNSIERHISNTGISSRA